MSRIGIGVVGTGRHGSRYARHLAEGDVRGARLAAICRRDREEGGTQAAEWDAAFHRDARDLAGDPEVEAIIVATPSRFHEEGVTAAAEAGKPVLVEKPLAPDLATCDRIVNTAEENQIPLMVAQTSRYEGPVRGLIDSLPSLGEIREVSLLLRSEDRTHMRGVFRPELDDGGALLDSGVHYFDLLPMIAGPIERVWCERHFIRGTAIDDGYTALLRTSAGARVVVDMGRWGNSRHETIEVVGERGILLASRTPPSLTKVVGRRQVDLPFPDVPGTLVPTMDDFLRVCRGEIEPPIAGADGRAAVAIVEACRRSAGAWIRLE